MRIALVSDAWKPQVNGVVTTLVELVRELQGAGHTVEVMQPGLFATRPCPGYPGIDLAIAPGRKVAALLEALQPDAIHIATEGPLGWAARRHCLRHRLAFTTAFHTKFPEILNAAARVPMSWGYALFRHFHAPSSGVMVPTRSVLRMLQGRGFRNLREWTHGVDTALFGYRAQPVDWAPLGTLVRPLSLYVGRVSYEKNIEAFLRTELPGTKVVCGVGPVLERLRSQYPNVKWVGLLPRHELAQLYGAADLFVFASHADTFGLVMVEAMACGTPVAAFPVDGPLEVLGRTDVAGRSLGGVMHPVLERACRAALAVPRAEARERALDFSWSEAARQFEQHLVAARPAAGPVRRLLQVATPEAGVSS
ncbi:MULTISPECIES: glycosyltransferase family 1 protein [Ramlibacter]|uniref:Glycosyltransferase family 1 protein n=1 Tax=Ramlibacter aquaticus TaxID=2780094 RepID=A0ABR9SGY3_9BURK|nr:MULTISPECIES: glycosyltransferase family 1 protein [Ramlibacter]MBE7941611.1 glycosyltransferase family 1 protein [Ramlibacter aquaticus]